MIHENLLPISIRTCLTARIHTRMVSQAVQTSARVDADIEVASSSTIKVPVYMGRFDMPVSYKGRPSSTAWTKVNAKTGLGFTFTDYPGATKIRGCMTFTDSSTNKGHLYARLRLNGGTNKVFFNDNYGNTWSGSGLIHHECGAWHNLKDVKCGYSWSNDCAVDVRHSQGVDITIYGASG